MRNTNLNLEDILTDRVREDDLLEVPVSERVFKIFFALVLLVSAAVFFKIFSIGVINHTLYEKRAIANASDIKVKFAPRGIIEDRFGNALVRNESSVNVFLIPRDFPKESGERIHVIQEVSDILGMNVGEVETILNKANWHVRDKLLLFNSLSQDQLVTLSTANLPGIEIEPAFKRVQFPSFLFAHAIGYMGLVNEEDLTKNEELVPDDLIGRDGLEAFYDYYLRGINGREVAYRDAKGEIKEERIVELPESGATLHTFLDKEFQEYFYNRLQIALESLGRTIGVGIAMNPKNGEILALFNIPSFNSEKIKSYLFTPSEPLFNRAISGLYNPGSTIKPLHATAALTEGVIKPGTQIYSPGYIEVPNPYNPESPSRFVDWKPQGWVDVFSALARSSNIYFYEVGGGFEKQKGLGILKLKEWWERFQLNQKTGIDLPGESAGFLPDPTWKEETKGDVWRLGDTYNVSIGQGDLTITPLELLNYISAIANGGKFFKPRIVSTIEDIKGNTIQTYTPNILSDLTNRVSSTISLVQRGMRDVVEKSYGTGYLLHDLPFAVAAKTGTAQVHLNERTNAFFVGYAPYDDPEIAILVLIENSKEGSHNTIPVAKDVLLWYYENRLKK